MCKKQITTDWECPKCGREVKENNNMCSCGQKISFPKLKPYQKLDFTNWKNV